MLECRNTKLAVIDAKAWDKPLTEGVAQAKDYASRLAVRHTYSSNGQGIYGIDLHTAMEGPTDRYPTPDELWQLTFATHNAWRDRFAAVPFEDKGGYFQGRCYQDVAIDKVLTAVAAGQQRILLTRADRADRAMAVISTHFNTPQQVFLDFVLSHYVAQGVDELDQAKLRPLLLLKYHDSITDAVAELGQPEDIGKVFSGFQRYLYEVAA